MAGTFEVIGSEIKITFEYQADSQIVQDTLEDAALWLYESEPWLRKDSVTEFEDYTNQEKLDLLDKWVKFTLRDAARNSLIATARENAISTAWAEAEDKYL